MITHASPGSVDPPKAADSRLHFPVGKNGPSGRTLAPTRMHRYGGNRPHSRSPRAVGPPAGPRAPPPLRTRAIDTPVSSAPRAVRQQAQRAGTVLRSDYIAENTGHY